MIKLYNLSLIHISLFTTPSTPGIAFRAASSILLLSRVVTRRRVAQ